MAEILSIISTISFITAGIFLFLTVLFGFIFKIPFVIGELTGKNARKSIVLQRMSSDTADAKRNLMQRMSRVSVIKEKPGTAELKNEPETAALAGTGETELLTYESETEEIILLEEVILIHTKEIIV